jgi:hypothetical protein
MRGNVMFQLFVDGEWKIFLEYKDTGVFYTQEEIERMES